MTPWSASSRVLEDKWRGVELQAHRARLAAIHGADVAAAVARAVGDGRAARPARSQSPAAKSRQRQIERDNLALIRKLLALDSRKPAGDARPRRPTSASASAPRRALRPAAADPVDLSAAIEARDHACQPLPDAPRSAASHALYTRRAAGGVARNAQAREGQSGAARRRSSAQRRILDENQRLLGRILSARTSVSRADWQRHEQEHRRLLGSLSRHGQLRATDRERERLARPASSATLLSGRDDVVAIGGEGDAARDAGSRPSVRRRSRPLTASSSAPALPAHSARANDSVVARMRRMVLEADTS